jgi:hypothetical protein
MELKKNNKANLENWRGVFFLLGLGITLSVLLFAFEMKSSAMKIVATNSGTTVFETDHVEITKREKPKVKKEKQLPIEKIKLVDNDKKTTFETKNLVPDNWNDDFFSKLEDDPEEDDFLSLFTNSQRKKLNSREICKNF